MHASHRARSVAYISGLFLLLVLGGATGAIIRGRYPARVNLGPQDGHLLLVETQPSQGYFDFSVLSYSFATGKLSTILSERRFRGGHVSFVPPNQLRWIAQEPDLTPVTVTNNIGRDCDQRTFLPPPTQFALCDFGSRPSSISPAGNLLAYASDWGAFSNHTALRIRAREGSWTEATGDSFFRIWSGDICLYDIEKQCLIANWDAQATDINLSRGGTEAWSPDSTELLFTSLEDRRLLDQSELDKVFLTDIRHFYAKIPQAVYVLDVQTGDSRRLARGTSGRWSPDGKHVIIKSRDEALCEALWMVDRQGSALTPLPTKGRWTTIPDFCWSPDKSYVCYLGKPQRGLRQIRQAISGNDYDTGVWISTADGSAEYCLFSGFFTRVFWLSHTDDLPPERPSHQNAPDESGTR